MNTTSRIIFVGAAKPLGEEQMRTACSGTPEEHPLWRTFCQLLDAETFEATLDVSEPDSGGEGRAHAAGRVFAAAELKRKLYELRAPREAPAAPARGRGVRRKAEDV